MCGTSKGFATTSPPGRRIATVLFLLETSIPTVFMFINKSPLLLDCNWSVPVLLIADSIYCGMTQTHLEGGSTCIKRTLQMRSWLSVCFTDAKSKKGADIPIALSSYSLSNKMGNSLLAVRDINHKYIVVVRRKNLCL